MKAFFEELFTYNLHCNQRLASVFSGQPTGIDAKSMALFSHMLNAHRIWNDRILGHPPAYKVWQNQPVAAFAAIDQHNYDQTLNILGTFGLADNIAYTTSGGQPFTNTVGDILFHIINHSTYHRGQIALLFRQHGVEPLMTDYIFYKR